MTIKDVGFNKINKLLSREYNKTLLNIVGVRRAITADSNLWQIDFISSTKREKQSPLIQLEAYIVDIKVEIRDMILSNLINEKEVYFDVEEIIYTKEQREKIKLLRGEQDIYSYYTDGFKAKEDILIKYSKDFSIGDKIYYKKSPGVISFKHQEKDRYQTWSVIVNEIEYRYVYGTFLAKREVKDISYVEIDPKLNKLSTEKLLKMYKRHMKLFYGRGNLAIKRILNDRENIPNK